MSKSIKKLSKKFENYDLNVEVVSGPQGSVTTKAFVTVFKNSEKGSIIEKKSSGYGTGATLAEAQAQSIDEAVKNLGL